MKFLIVAGIVAVVWAPSVLADNASKVKLVGATSLTADNTEYIPPSSIIINVVQGNATHNFLRLAFDIVKDLPTDALNVYNIYRSNRGSNGECSTYQKIKEFSVSLCSDQNSVWNQYLSDELQQIKKSATCGKKNRLDLQRGGTVKFYNLLTDDQLKNGCFRLINGLVSAGKYLYKEQLDFESN